MRALVGLAVVVVAVLSGAAPASAHVTVNPREAVQGAYGKFSFRVPNEKDTASTVKLEVFIPMDTPIASVSTRPVPGWTVALERSKLTTPLKLHDSEVTEVITKITWTASEGNAITPGQFQEFDVSAGPLPEVDRVVFKALQTYSDGKIVRWIDEPTTDGTEPEHPAPVLTLTAAGQTTAATTMAAAVTTSTDGGGSSTGTWLGLAGLAVGLAGLVTALVAYRRSTAPTG